MTNAALHAVLQEYGKERKVPTMVRLYPDEKLLAGPLEDKSGMVSYRADLEFFQGNAGVGGCLLACLGGVDDSYEPGPGPPTRGTKRT